MSAKIYGPAKAETELLAINFPYRSLTPHPFIYSGRPGKLCEQQLIRHIAQALLAKKN